MNTQSLLNTTFPSPEELSKLADQIHCVHRHSMYHSATQTGWCYDCEQELRECACGNWMPEDAIVCEECK